MIDLERFQSAFARLPAGVARAEVNAERIRRVQVSVRDGKPSSSESYDRVRYYIRAGGDALGMVYTESPEDDAAGLLLRAAENAAWGAPGDASPMNKATPSDPGWTEPDVSVADLIRVGAQAEAMLGDADVHGLDVSFTTREMRTVNTLGLDRSFGTHWTELHGLIARDRPSGISAEAEVFVSAAGISVLNPAYFAGKATRLIDLYDGHGAAPIRLESGRYDAVLTGQVMRNILMTAWRAFAADQMAGGRSPFRAAGDRVGSAACTLINAPAHPLTAKVWPVDSEGTAVRRTVVVRRGILEEPLYTLSSAARRGAASNGCAGRVPVMTGNVPINLATVPALFYLERGNASMDSLIRRMDTGIVLTYSLDLFHSVNVASGQFSVPCGGFYVKNGRIAGSVSQMTVAGTLPGLFSAIADTADDLDFDDFYFRNYCVGSPSALLEGLHFSA